MYFIDILKINCFYSIFYKAALIKAKSMMPEGIFLWLRVVYSLIEKHSSVEMVRSKDKYFGSFCGLNAAESFHIHRTLI